MFLNSPQATSYGTLCEKQGILFSPNLWLKITFSINFKNQKDIAELDIKTELLAENETEHTTQPGNDKVTANHTTIIDQPETTSQQGQQGKKNEGINF